jgi:hypothetical protein
VFRKASHSEKKKTPGQPCRECGRPGAYNVDQFGTKVDYWTCVQCHEDSCRRHIRNDTYIRYGKNP